MARIAEPGEGIGLDELALATRNHGMPLEALRYDVTPPGLHYVLTHYDIPAVDPATWRLEIGGAVERPAEPVARRAARRPRSPRGCCSSAPATAGPASSRGRSASRGCWRPSAPPSGPAPRSRPLLEEAGVSPDAVDVVFTGADHGVERGVEQDYAGGGGGR